MTENEEESKVVLSPHESSSDSSVALEEHVSRISLRLRPERTNLRNKSSLTLNRNLDADETETDIYEGAGTSKDLTNEVQVIFSKILQEIPGEAITDVDEKPKPPAYTILDHTFAQFFPETEVFEPREIIEITPPPCPPIVLYSAPPLQGAPPTYSAIMRIGPTDVQPRRSIRLFGRRPEIRIQPSPPFIAPLPPPSYAEAQGLCLNQARPLVPTTLDYDDSIWGIEPISVICPMCNNFVVTTVRTRRSNLTHFSALALCICGCWPCCLLPYCIKTCKTTFHECPICYSIIGMYNPW